MRATWLFVRRLTSAGFAALVLILSILAASPTLHKHLHADADHEGHECAIVFLAQGVTLTPHVVVAPAAEHAWLEIFPALPKPLLLVARKNLLPLQCGPPSVDS